MHYLVVDSRRMDQHGGSNYGLISLWGRSLDEAGMREYAEHNYECPVDATLPQVIALLYKYGWTVMAEVDPGPPYRPGIQFVAPI